jgi:hypothetical protein
MGVPRPRSGRVRADAFRRDKNLVEPIERRTRDGPAGPQRRQEPKRCVQSHAFDWPVSGEGRKLEQPDQTKEAAPSYPLKVCVGKCKRNIWGVGGWTRVPSGPRAEQDYDV